VVVTEPGLDSITISALLGEMMLLGVGRVGEEMSVPLMDCQMTVADVQFPTFDLLQPADHVNTGVRSFDQEKGIGHNRSIAPASQNAAQPTIGIRWLPNAFRGKSKAFTERAGQHGANAQSQRRRPRRVGHGLLKSWNRMPSEEIFHKGPVVDSIFPQAK